MIPEISAPFAKNRANAPAYWLIDIVWYILIDGEDTGGSYSLIEQFMREGSGPIPHVHAFIDEWFYVLEGKIDFTVGDDRFTAGPGDSLWIPRNTVHVFTSMTDCHVLNAYTPAGFEQVIKGSATPAAARELPPKDLPAPSEEVFRLFYNNYWCVQADKSWCQPKSGVSPGDRLTGGSTGRP